MGGGGSSGGGGGTTQQSNQYSMISPWAQPYVSGILGAAQQQVFNTQSGTDANGNPTTDITGIRPFNAYGSYTGQTDANGNQTQYGMNPSANAAANASVAGFQPLQNQAYQGAQNLSNSMAPNVTGAAAFGSLNAGQNLQNQSTNPNAVGAYMNPYIQNTLDPALQLLNQQYGIAGQQQQGQATQSGAFGGTRQILQNGLNQQNQMLAQNQLVGNAYNQAFNNAQNQMNTVAQTGLQGYNQAGSLAGQQLGQQQGILGLQNQFGGQQQQQQQNIINAGMSNYQQAQQYPMTQLQQLKSLTTGLPIQDVTTTQQQAQPSGISQLAGLGTAGVAGLALASKAAAGGLMKSYKAGGHVQRFDGGGISAINNKVLRGAASPDQINRSTKDGIVAPQVGEIGKAIALSEKVNGQNASAMSQPPPQGTIMDELQSKSDSMDQQEMLKDAVPKAMAVLKHKIEKAIIEGDIPKAQKYTNELDQLMAMVQGKESETPSAPAPEGIEQLAPQAGAPAQPQQGIEAAPSNLPTQGMAEGGIAHFASRGYVDEDEYESPEDKEDAELKQMYGSGTDNDFIQSIMASSGKTAIHPSAAVQMAPEEKTMTKKGTHKYEDIVIKEAKRLGLPPEIAVHALYKETGNLPNPETATSKAGAYGPMQLMKATAKELGVDRMDPIQNAMGGVGYLKKLYDKYQDPQLTLMAYNAGPGRVDRALKSAEGIQSLPRETLNYRMAEGGIARYSGTGPSLVGPTGESISEYLEKNPENIIEKEAEKALTKEGKAAKEAVDKAASRAAEIKSSRVPTSAAAAEGDTLAMQGLKGLGRNVVRPILSGPGAFVGTGGYAASHLAANALSNATDEELQMLQGDIGSDTSMAASALLAGRKNPTVAPAAVPAKPVASVQPAPAAPAAAPAAPAPAAPTAAAPSNVSPAAQAGIEKLNATTTEPSYVNQIAAEIMADVRSRKEQAQKTREQNNLLAWMNAGFGMAASKNIHPLGALGEGGQQGISTLMAGRKQEAEEAKDIAAQQYGLYKVAGAAEQNKVLNEIKNAQFDAKQTSGAREDYREYVNDFETKLKNKYPMVALTGKETPQYTAEKQKFYNSPEIKSLREKAFPNIYASQAAGASTSERPPISTFQNKS